uniref:NADH-ubiquinone oxidoreductase chain 3 n=1 Tax=Linguatula serrata TaxID=646052 RepID=A0A385UJ69_9CRUS|nr:NADH dehydrogenase subunit 3 [Linguatula serrata]AYB71160.1 NADH dehydrogenase subunit 3 [Linguatula serrata]
MYSSQLMLLIPLMILVLFFPLCLLLSPQPKSNSNLSSSYECGFDPKCNSRIPFSLQFFLITLTFLMFDIELIIILPLPLLTSLNLKSLIPSSIALLSLLIISLAYEKSMGMLSCTK